MIDSPETKAPEMALEDLGISRKHFKAVTHAQREGSKPAIIASMKVDRMVIKNERRAKQGLPPLTDYRKI